MNFSVSTKPLKNALDLGIINQNVSKFYHKSCLAQVSADRHTLRINTEAANVMSEEELKGSGDSDELATIFVDCLLLKQLLATFESSVTTLEFTETSLILHSGKSKFTLPKMLDTSEMSLNRPAKLEEGSEQYPSIAVNKNDWAFIKDHQMYAIAMSFIHPVYTRAWVGQDGHVLVGDFDNSIFTCSSKSKLGVTCLLSDTIINLFNSLPEGAVVKKARDSYIISVSTDGFSYISEFKPVYESDEGIGSYNSDIILEMMKHEDSRAVKIDTTKVNTSLSQAALLSAGTEDTIKFTVSDGFVSLVGSNIDCKLPVDSCPVSYEIQFKTALLKSVMSNFDENEVFVAPMMQGDEVAGIVAWTSNMTVVLAGVDE